jgi:DNA-binding XRE family transcriptional regulator
MKAQKLTAEKASYKVFKHFDYSTSFSSATNDEELAEIMRLKYPKACSNLETGAEFFARMVEEVKRFEAWRVIGFDSFESFCQDKLGKTLSEVEEIVEGVKLLGGNPTAAQAKEASRSAKAAELVRAGTHTQAEAAREVGVSKQAVSKAASQPKQSNRKKVDPQPTIKLTKDPTLTAKNILAKMGRQWVKALQTALDEAGRATK